MTRLNLLIPTNVALAWFSCTSHVFLDHIVTQKSSFAAFSPHFVNPLGGVKLSVCPQPPHPPWVALRSVF